MHFPSKCSKYFKSSIFLSCLLASSLLHCVCWCVTATNYWSEEQCKTSGKKLTCCPFMMSKEQIKKRQLFFSLQRTFRLSVRVPQLKYSDTKRYSRVRLSTSWPQLWAEAPQSWELLKLKKRRELQSFLELLGPLRIQRYSSYIFYWIAEARLWFVYLN